MTAPTKFVLEGQPSGIAELRVEWILDAIPTSGWIASRPCAHTPASHVYEIWAAEFDRACDEGGLFVVTMHPHVIGPRSLV
jgi:peptidoglycan-N-acetylglucosamine deacetylase